MTRMSRIQCRINEKPMRVHIELPPDQNHDSDGNHRALLAFIATIRRYSTSRTLLGSTLRPQLVFAYINASLKSFTPFLDNE
jgi:hypothetical protein